MNTRINFLCYISVLIFCITSVCNWNMGACYASGSESEGPKWFVFATEEVPEITLKQEEKAEVTLAVRASREREVHKIAVNTRNTPFTIKGVPKLYQKDEKDKYIEVNHIGGGDYFLKFTIMAKESTSTKTYNLPIIFLAGDAHSDIESYQLEDVISVTYEAEEQVVTSAELTISDIQCKSVMQYGETADVVYTIKNTGDGTATNIIVDYEGMNDDGILPAENGVKKKLSPIKPNKSRKITLPVKVSKNAVSGSKKITIRVSYHVREEDTNYVVEREEFYIRTERKRDTKPKAPKILIRNIRQSEKMPVAGENVTLSFDILNVGKLEAKNITVTPKELSRKTFTPLGENPAVYIKSLKIGQKRSVKLSYNISRQIEGGLSYIDYAVVFRDANGIENSDSVKLYVKNIKAKKEDVSKGVPRLIIKKYTAGKESVMAGGMFKLKFDVANTHVSSRAENIRVTMTSDETGAFSIAKGSNSFYITSIEAKNCKHMEIPIKVNGNCTTKSYPLKLEFQYDYRSVQNGKEVVTSGVLASEVLSIQVEENARPSLNIIKVGAYGELIYGEADRLTFEFHNQGKSPLYNVQIEIKGDFETAQKSYYIGTVEAGKGSSHEAEITPIVEGTATGVMIVTYENSNGKKGKKKAVFKGEVVPATGINVNDMGTEPDNVDNAKRNSSISLPVFILVEVMIFALSALVVRRFMISRYRKKKLLEEEMEL